MNQPNQHPATLVDFLRHGEPVGGDKYRGAVDDPLSPTGWQQMRDAVGKHSPWTVVVSSPLSRCAAFAQETATRLNLPLVIDDDLREMRFGLWEGRTGADILATDHDRLTAFWRDPLRNPPPEGEHLNSVLERTAAAWERITTRFSHGHLLLVTHGGVIRVLLGHLLGIPLDNLSRLTVPYAALTRIHLDASRTPPLPRLIFHAGKL